MATVVCGSGRPAAPREFCGSGKFGHLGGTVAAVFLTPHAAPLPADGRIRPIRPIGPIRKERQTPLTAVSAHALDFQNA